MLNTSASIGIIGYGSFGQFVHILIQKYLPNTEILVYEKYPSKHTLDIEMSDFSLVASADILIPCVPISEYNTTIDELVKFIKDDALIIDICTIKEHTSRHLKQISASKTNIHYISTHPMFGPNSYAKKGDTLQDLRLVICDQNCDQEVFDTFIDLLEKTGLNIIHQSAEKHDKHLAVSLFFTHYIAQTMFAGGFDRTPIDTASFGYLMDAVEIVRDNKGLFEDVYRFNPYCQEMIDRFNLSREEIEHELSSLRIVNKYCRIDNK